MKNLGKNYYFLWILASIYIIGCKHSSSEMPFPQKLSEWNFFKDLKSLTPHPHVIPYDINTPLFSDYAEKARFIYVPKGSKIIYNDTSFFHFPDESVLIKNFFYYKDVRNPELGKKIIETRLLYKKNGSWIPLTYQWNETQTDAEMIYAGNYVPVQWIDAKGVTQKIEYRIPNLNQCKSCHENQGIIQPIGIKAKHLNKNFLYEHGEENQLSYWLKKNILENLPKQSIIPRLVNFEDTTKSLEERARAWLDINCAHCHNPKGPAATSGLFLNSEENHPTQLGIMKSPIAAGKGTGGRSFDIVPGKPQESILYYRLSTNEPGEMMPELGRTIVHKESLKLIHDWIFSLKQ